jgi:hypothetical protein
MYLSLSVVPKVLLCFVLCLPLDCEQEAPIKKIAEE